MKKDILYLGSQSSARRRLLEYAKINYQVIAHGSDEILASTPPTFKVSQVLTRLYWVCRFMNYAWR